VPPAPAASSESTSRASTPFENRSTSAGAGGTGETGDWAAAREAVRECSVPVVLAGGLTPENVGAAVAAVDPFAVDVASGVERRGGRKNHDAVREFIARAAGTRTRSERTVEP
jgi:phosphoribosylanthranilate isomerase